MTKLKEALFYSIHKNYFVWRVVAVTTQKPSGKWHGRYVVDNEVTHGVGSSLIGRFDTAEAALAMVDDVQKVKNHFEPLRKALNDKATRLFREEQNAMENAALGRSWSEASDV